MTHHYGVINIDTRGTAYMPDRIYFIHAAVEELQSNGFLSETTLDGLSKPELMLVMQRGLSRGAR